MTALLFVLVVVFGLAVGSFLNVVIVRVPSDESILRPPSKCPQCEAPIANRDNIPIVSWVLLKGKCRNCGEPIHWGYPVVEALNGLLWALAFVRFGDKLVLLPYLFCFSVLLVLSAIDIQIYRLPDKIVFFGIGVSVVVLPLVGLWYDAPELIWSAAISGVAYFVFLFIPAWIYPKGMGFGDVKLAAFLGLYLGFLNAGTYVPVLMILSLIISSLIGVVIGIGALIVRGGKSKPYPFGPWLALGCVVAILFSRQLMSFYGF